MVDWIRSLTSHFLVFSNVRYLQRFEDELEQISIKHSIGTHRKDQHAVRKKNIELLMEQERAEYDGPGFGTIHIFFTGISKNYSVVIAI